MVRPEEIAVIILQVEYNSGWVDIAHKILWFLGNPIINCPFFPASPLKKTFYNAAKIEEWPKKTSKLGEAEHPLVRFGEADWLGEGGGYRIVG